MPRMTETLRAFLPLDDLEAAQGAPSAHAAQTRPPRQPAPAPTVSCRPRTPRSGQTRGRPRRWQTTDGQPRQRQPAPASAATASSGAAVLLQQRREDDEGEEAVGHRRDGRQHLDDRLDHLAHAEGQHVAQADGRRTPSGTATTTAPSVTSALPTKMARAPNAGGSATGYQAVLVKNSREPLRLGRRAWRPGR